MKIHLRLCFSNYFHRKAKLCLGFSSTELIDNVTHFIDCL